MVLTQVLKKPHVSSSSHRNVRSRIEPHAVKDCTFVSCAQLTSKGVALVGEIMCYRNESVIERYMTDNHAPREEAEAAFRGLLQFLLICVLNKGSHTPSKKVDEMWHCFILHMREYEAFCRGFLRQMVYHDPAHDDSAFKYYAVARNCVISLFGEADESVWPLDHQRYTRCISCDAPTMFLEDCIKAA
jgi:hypothetical protein